MFILASIPAILSLISCPSLTIVVSFLIATFPFSTPAMIPTAANSLMIGPGANGVGPAGMIMSLGEVCPGFAGAGLLFCLIILYILNGFSFVNISAGTPFMYFVSSVIPGSFVSFSPKSMSFFLVMNI